MSLTWFAAALALHLGTAPAKQAEFGSPKDAQALVAKAVASIKKVGAQKTFDEINTKGPALVDRDLYVTAYDLQGKCLAQGSNAKMAGKDLIDMRDAAGHPFVKERVELARTKSSFWQDYMWTDPITRKLMPKTTYCERHDEVILCVGVYKR
jgi:signal transduction histidine kinase